MDGVIDVIATDHAPHHYEEKEREFDDAPFGIIGLETAFGLGMKRAGRARAPVAGRAGGPDVLLAGADHGDRCGDVAARRPADIVLFDPEERWTVEPEAFLSRSRNTPFGGRELTGRVHVTLVGGVERYRRSVPDEAA